MMQDHQARSAEMQAAFHRQKAGEYFAEHRRQLNPSFLTRAKDEMATAASFEVQARSLRGQSNRTQGEAKKGSVSVAANPEKSSSVKHQSHGESEKASQERARRWFAPGSVASDMLTQLSEAGQGGGILAQTATYAARSALDKDHRTMDGAKLLGKAVGAPAKAVGAAGKDILNAARQYQVQGHAEQNKTKGKAQVKADRERQAPAQPSPNKGHER